MGDESLWYYTWLWLLWSNFLCQLRFCKIYYWFQIYFLKLNTRTTYKIQIHTLFSRDIIIKQQINNVTIKMFPFKLSSSFIIIVRALQVTEIKINKKINDCSFLFLIFCNKINFIYLWISKYINIYERIGILYLSAELQKIYDSTLIGFVCGNKITNQKIIVSHIRIWRYCTITE